MKKLVLFIGLFAGLSALFAGCSKDDTKDPVNPPEPPAPKTRTMQFDVAYTLQGETTGLSFAWSDGDASKLGIVGSAGKVVSSSKIKIGSSSAVFTGEIPADETSVYCFYPTASNASLTFAPFMIEASRTQAHAGDGLEGAQLPLISNAVAIPAEGESVSVAAKAVPTILRLAVYSSDEVLQTEQVKNISLQAAEKINGTYTWNLSLQSGSVTEGGAVSSVALTNHYALTGIGAVADAKSIYMMVAPVPIASGYKYLISTNKASYIYTAKTAGEFAMGKVLDVAIDLKDAERTEKGIITFDGSALDGYECEANASAAATEIGAFKVSVSGVESIDYTKEFYKNQTFSVKDVEGAAATWVTPSIGADGKISLTWEMNPAGTERTATITANFTLTDDSYWYDGNPAFEFSVKQKPTVVTYDISNFKNYTSWYATSEGFTEKDLGWFFAVVNGVADSAAAGYRWSFYNFRFEAKDAATGEDITWAKAFCKAENNHLFLICEPNTGGARVAKINVYNLYGENEKVFAEITVNQHEASSKSIITYKATINNGGTYNAPAAGETEKDMGYYLAYVDACPTQEPNWGPYYELTYTYTDDAGQPVTWLSCKRKAGDANHPLVTTEPNTGGMRRAYIKASWAGNAYAEAAANPIFTIAVVQVPNSGNYVTYSILGVPSNISNTAKNKQDLGYYHAYVNGSTKSEQEENLVDGVKTVTPRYNLTLTCDDADWISGFSVSYPENNNHMYAKMTKNETGAPRTATIKAHYSEEGYSTLDPIFTFTVTQQK